MNIEFGIEESSWIGVATITSINNNVYPIEYEMQIKTLYKGNNKITSIASGLGGPDCGFIFNLNEEYLIYGSTFKDSIARTTYCSRTAKTSQSPDIDYLNNVFKDKNIKLEWSENFINFVEYKTQSEIDGLNPPIIFSKEYEAISVLDIIGRNPNSLHLEMISLSDKELKKLPISIKTKVEKGGILIEKYHFTRIKRRKLIRKLKRM